MGYWILLFIFFTLWVALGIYILNKKIKSDIENDEFIAIIIMECLILVCFIIMSIDLPSAISGGQEMYVNELPTLHYYGRNLSYLETDNAELKQLRMGNWEKYDKYGNYRIRYTKHMKFVLDIEPLD